ncbi:endo-1,4-beta-xylanase 5-like [Silene latifolia]|uniref:endo-1,4-beta-xylanase 5-like n=1 Tax=Silene latifolia TaxID=37657 RepID=UPI003D77BEDB
MKIKLEESTFGLLLASLLLIFGGVFSSAVQYDYTAVIDCLADPLKPQYNGGIIINPEINDGVKGWTTHGGVKIEQRSSISGNKYMVAHNRKQPYASVSHKVLLEKDKLYTFSAWIQVAGKNTTVTALFKTGDGFEKVGAVEAQVGCWSMFKGGISVASSTPAELYFESNDTSVDIWVDSVSLQPFTNEEWRSHQEQSIQKVRKSNMRLQVVDQNGRPIPNANITIQQNRLRFPLGASINQNIVRNTAYQNWFTQRFTVTTFENEMKWYTTENTQGREDYSAADSMLAFTSQHRISVRGHNIFWDDPQYQPWWVKNLSPQSLGPATDKRLNSVVSRYRGRVIAWDVNNENLHFNFYESKLGGGITNKFFQRTRQLDRRAMLFMNDYNTIEDGRDSTSSPSKYIAKLRQLQASLGANSVIGIGLEGHFHTVNIAYVRSALDTLAATRMPIWITELDVQAGPSQAAYFEQILREVHAHPGIQGIVIWGPWSQNGQCYQMCLVDPSFRNLAPGNVLDKLIHEWGGATAQATTNDNGYIDVSLFHGDYEAKFVPQGGRVDEVSPQGKSLSFAVDHNSSGQVIKFVSHV